MPVFEDYKFDSWSDFKLNWKEVIKEKRSGELSDVEISKTFVFRGTGCSTHHLISSFDRLLEEQVPHEVEDSFALYPTAISSYVASGRKVKKLNEAYEFSPDMKDPFDDEGFLKAEAHAQHHGMPTRLLDWSYSPYMAAFFANSNFGLCRSGLISIWCLDTEETKKAFRREIQVITSRYYDNARLISQRGCFTRNESNLTKMDLLFAEDSNRFYKKPEFPILIRLDIPVGFHKEALEDLEYMGIDFLSVYPDLDGVKEKAKFKLLEAASQNARKT